MVNKSKKRVSKKSSSSKSPKKKKIDKAKKDKAVSKQKATKRSQPEKSPVKVIEKKALIQTTPSKLQIAKLAADDKKQMAKRLDSEKTLIEIIEDTKSGIAAQSELDKKEKNKFLRKRDAKKGNKDQQSEEHKSQNSSAIKQISRQTNAPKSQISHIAENLHNKHFQQPAQQQQISLKPKLVLVNGRPQIQAQQQVMNMPQQAVQNALAEGREITVVNSGNNKLSSLSFMKRQPSEKWKPEETQKFFMALQIFGTDFSLIEQIFNQERTRDQIKNKFRKEERKSKKFVDELLQNKEGTTLKGFEEKYGKIDLGEEDNQYDDMMNEESETSEDEDNSDEESSDKEGDSSSKGNDMGSSQKIKFESPIAGTNSQSGMQIVARGGAIYNNNNGFMSGAFHQSHTLFPPQRSPMLNTTHNGTTSYKQGKISGGQMGGPGGGGGFSLNTF